MIRPVRPDGRIETGGVFVPILRWRVLERIASAAMQRVVLLIAPAGYGKSVALRQHLQTVSEPCVRFDVLPEHAALLGFLRGFSDALADIAPDVRTTLAGAYEKNATSQTAGADLAMWMHSHIKSFRGVIAIDDLQIAQDDRDVTRFLSSLIERTKGRVQWIIASRSTVGLPIGTWLAYGDSDLAIDEHDLKFTVEEAKEAARAFKLGVRDEELYELIHLTEGWATAMSFALRSSTRSVDLRNISAMTREMIYRYLAEQVYHTLADDERDFLEAAALLSEIDVETMVAAGYDRAAGMIEDLRQRVSFIHEQTPGVYRLHDLFREFVLHQLSLKGEAHAREARTRIAGVLRDRALFDRALRLYADASSFDDALRLMDEHGVELLAKGHADVLIATIDTLDREHRQNSHVVLRLSGLFDIAAGRFEEGERAILRAIRGSEHEPQSAELLLRVAASRVNRGEDVAALLSEAVADEKFPAVPRLEAQAMLAVLAARSGNRTAATAHLACVADNLADVHDEAIRARVLQRLGVTHLELGELLTAKELLQKASEAATNMNLWSQASRAYNALSAVSMFGENDTTLCLWYAQQAASAATKAGDYYDLQASLLHILSIETQRGNVERAMQVERQLAEFRSNDPYRAIHIAASQAHRRAWNGEFAEAHRLFASVKARISYPPDRALAYAMDALVLSLDSQPRDSAVAVEDALAAIDASAGQSGLGSALFEAATLFCALAESLAGRHTAASRILRRQPMSAHRSMASLREAVSALGRVARSKTYSDDIAARADLLRGDGFGSYARYLHLAERRIQDGHEPSESVKLTPSELRILRLLAAGMAPKDVAAEMGRSVYTIQTHIQNLIEKLGCHGRTEAIAAARRIGLLDEAL